MGFLFKLKMVGSKSPSCVCFSFGHAGAELLQHLFGGGLQ